MSRLFSYILIAVLIPSLSVAQTTDEGFVGKIQKDVAGWGGLVIKQDQRLTRLIDNDSLLSRKRETRKRNANNANTTGGVSQGIPTGGDENLAVQRPTRVRRYKTNGFRVQIFAGNNSRSSRIEAEKTAREFKELFPQVPSYTHFYPPRWVCRVGDFKTSEEAQSFMQQIRQTKEFPGLIVVKTTIQLPYRSDGEHEEQ